MGTCYLTIDDAPSADLPEKLAILEEREVPALWFCEGGRLAEYPEHARRAVEAGSHLGNHAYAHRHASVLSVGAFRNEVVRTERRLAAAYDAAGVERPGRPFRFPYGDRGGDRREQFQAVLAEEGFDPMDAAGIRDLDFHEEHGRDRDWYWTVDVEDWVVETRAGLAEMIEAWADRLERPDDDVLLFHDACNEPARFVDLLDLLDERGVRWGDPLALLQ